MNSARSQAVRRHLRRCIRLLEFGVEATPRRDSPRWIVRSGRWEGRRAVSEASPLERPMWTLVPEFFWGLALRSQGAKRPKGVWRDAWRSKTKSSASFERRAGTGCGEAAPDCSGGTTRHGPACAVRPSPLLSLCLLLASPLDVALHRGRPLRARCLCPCGSSGAEL